MIKPTIEQLQSLSTTERTAFHLADWCNQHVKVPFMYWNAAFMYALIWFGLSRRLTVIGIENVAHITPKDSVLFAANHRTFFDFFVITWINFDRTNLSKRIFFPVRSTFFYDNWIGSFINLVMGGCAMFPPIFREKDKKDFNKYSIDRIVYELNQGNATVGFHPEGRRNPSSDPYSFLPAKPGVGHVVQRCPNTNVIPVFIIGMTNNYPREFYRNWFCPKDYPITVYYGSPLETHSESTHESPERAHQIAEQSLQAIQDLATEHQRKQGASLS